MRHCTDIAILLLWVLQECFIMPINNDSITLQETLMLKVLKSSLKETRCLSACRKSTSSITFFSRYCYDIANLLFWELWKCLIIPIIFIASIWSKLSCLSACKKINFITLFILKILQRNNKRVIFEETFGSNLGAKNQLHISRFPWDIAKIL